MDEKRLKKDISPFFKMMPQVISAYLFGSVAKNVQGKDSDVDIAIYLEDSTPTEIFNDIRFELMEKLENYFRKHIDLVVLNNASLRLFHQVLKNGMLIFSNDPARTEQIALKKQKEYFDFKYYIDKDIKEMKSFFLHSS